METEAVKSAFVIVVPAATVPVKVPFVAFGDVIVKPLTTSFVVLGLPER